MLYPLKFNSIYKENIWGGDSLEKIYKRSIPSSHTGESWDIACHSNGMSVVSNGPLTGITLQQIFTENKKELLGPNGINYDKFPLLVKIIDARDRLSLQVHPDDLYANLLENGEYGKCEMWYVLKAKEGAKITMGLKDGVTKQDFIKGMIDGNLEECINEMVVREGDVINIPAGLIHAIEEDIMIAEVQQNSDTVYRVYDWKRIDSDGKPRELHVEKALGSIDFDHRIKKEKVQGLEIKINHNIRKYYIANDHFAIEKLIINDYLTEKTELRKMFLYICLSGEFEVNWKDMAVKLNMGESILIPACIDEFELTGKGEVLKAYIPDIEKDIFELLKDQGFTNEEIKANIALY